MPSTMSWNTLLRAPLPRLLRQAERNIRLTYSRKVGQSRPKTLKAYRHKSTVELLNSRHIWWIGKMLWYIAKRAMQWIRLYQQTHLQVPFLYKAIHRRRLLLFFFSHSSRSAFSAASASFSSAISRFLLSSYAFACLSSAGVRLPVGF